MTLLDRSRIESCVPQSGPMCLLDAVDYWDASSIICRAEPPGADHPLLRDGALHAIAVVEYAAQATAVHGALVEPNNVVRPGMLVKLAGVELCARRIAPGGPVLTVRAEQLSANSAGCRYRFKVCAGDVLVVRGELIVAFRQE